MNSTQYVSISDALSDKITGEWGTDPIGENDLKVLGTRSFNNDGTISYDIFTLRAISENKAKSKCLQKGDIILEKSGGSDNQPVGRVVYFNRDDEPYLCNNFTQILRPRSNIDTRYLFWALYNLHRSGRTLTCQNKTTGIRNLDVNSYLNMKIPLPPLPEQKRIAETLDKAHRLIDLRKKQIEEMDRLAQAVFNEMFGDPVKNPMKWDTATLNTVCKKITDGTHFSPPNSNNGKYLYVTAKNIKIDGIDLSDITYIDENYHRPIYSRCDPIVGDVLYIKDGVTTGIACINTINQEFSLLSSVALLRPNEAFTFFGG